MTNILYTSDFMVDEVLGGGELNDYELCKLLQNNYSIDKVKCSKLTKEMIDNKFLIVSNFVTMSPKIKNYITNNCRYIIYEHDHKYLKNRNPGVYDNFIAPKDQIVNYDFYKNAKLVLCQSSLHKNIMERNLGINNVFNLSGNLWSKESLGLMKELSSDEKVKKYSILNSNNWHKNTQETIFYCKKKNIDFELIGSQNYDDFLKLLSRNSHFIFLPKTPETLSRVVVEAKMMGVKVVTNKRVGATHEDWYGLDSNQILETMIAKRQEIFNKVVEVMNE